MPTVLVDTNILIYAHDSADPVKQAKAIQVLDHLQTHTIVRLSTQTLGEFFAATTRGKHPLLTVTKASKQIENLALSWVLLRSSSSRPSEAFEYISSPTGMRSYGRLRASIRRL